MGTTTQLYWGDGYLKIRMSMIPESLRKELRYWHRDMQFDPQAGKQVMVGEYRNLFTEQPVVDDKQQVVQELLTMSGFMYRVKKLLVAMGVEYTIIDERTPRPPFNMNRALSGLRDYQWEGTHVALHSGGGIIACPTGWGKTHIMASLVDAYDHADLCARNTPLTVIACSDKDIIAKNYKDIKAILPHRDVQLITGDNADYSADVQCITLDSLKKLNPEEIGILIVDEVHSAATPSRSEHLLAATKAIVWGLSATPTGRFDGSDLVTEGIHGPVVYRRTYQQGVEVGALVPINVYFVRVPEPAIGMKRYSNYKTRRGKYNQAVIKGSVQNGIVADLLKGIPDSLQTLCIMQQTGQMNEIVGLLPDIDYVHAKTNDKELQKMSQFNLVGIKAKERAKIYKNMANGTTRKILSTHVYKQGVDFPELSVMICPGGGGSDIAAAQVPGRASRKIEGKDSSILIDFWHDWDVVEKNGRKNQGPILKDDRSRDRVYESLGFNRYWVDSVEDLLTIINAV